MEEPASRMADTVFRTSAGGGEKGDVQSDSVWDKSQTCWPLSFPNPPQSHQIQLHSSALQLPLEPQSQKMRCMKRKGPAPQPPSCSLPAVGSIMAKSPMTMIWTMAAFHLHCSQHLLTLGKMQRVTGLLLGDVISDHLPSPTSIKELAKDVKR